MVPTSAANRYDAALGISAVAPNAPVRLAVYPTNDLWFGSGSSIATPSSGNPAIALAGPTFGAADVTASYAPFAMVAA